PMTMRPPERVTRTISRAVSNGRGANIAPNMLTTRSNCLSGRSRADASPCWKWRLARPASRARRLPAATRFAAMSTPRTVAPRRADGSAVVPSPIERVDERVSALAHGIGKAGEIALLPQCPVRVDDYIRHGLDLSGLRGGSARDQQALPGDGFDMPV